MEALLTTHPMLWAIGAFAGVARGWLAYRTAVRREEEYTKRVRLAVERIEGCDRAAVVRAAGQLAPAVTRRARSG
ncbi:hypothetical protein EDD99_4142 [Streptomyces sp. 846.5]|nr:hypothetical protein EDD99_4142 [Streptomyces sp. 846.5]